MSSHFYHSLSLCDWSSAISFTVTGITHNCVGNTTGHGRWLPLLCICVKSELFLPTPANVSHRDRLVIDFLTPIL